MSEFFTTMDPTIMVVSSVAMVCVTVILAVNIFGKDEPEPTPAPVPVPETPAVVIPTVDPNEGLTVWTSTDGEKCIEFVNNFRANPSSIPLTSAQTSKGMSTGSPEHAVVWSDELFDLCKEHSIYQAKAEKISHDGFSERMDRYKSCTAQLRAENVAMTRLSGESALQKAVTRWA